MGSLRTMQYHDVILKQHHVAPSDIPVQKKKPMQMILGVLKSDSDPNRSPLDSPPTEKKRLKRLSNILLTTGNGTAVIQNYAPIEEKENFTEGELQKFQQKQQENQKPQKPENQLTSRSSILKKRPLTSPSKSLPTKCSHSRKVQFQKDVLVQYIGGETDSTHEPLTEDHDRMAFLARNILRRSQSQDCSDSFHPSFQVGSLHSCQSTSQLPAFQDNPIYRPPSTSSPSSSPPSSSSSSSKSEQPGGKTVTISFSQNTRGHTFMKFVLFMGPHYDPDNIVVKANMSGNRLRVVANRVQHQDNEDVVKEEYNERYQLPMQVDPYRVEARLDSRGYLTVDAPLMTSDQRKVVEQKSGSITV